MGSRYGGYTLTVKELIKVLETLDQNRLIVIDKYDTEYDYVSRSTIAGFRKEDGVYILQNNHLSTKGVYDSIYDAEYVDKDGNITYY